MKDCYKLKRSQTQSNKKCKAMCTQSDDDSEIEIASDDEVSQTCFIGMSDSEESKTKIPKFFFNHSYAQIDYLIIEETLDDSVSSKKFK